jgi:hypothetical protein
VSALLQKRWDFSSLPLFHYQEFFSVWALHEACEQQIDPLSIAFFNFFFGVFLGFLEFFERWEGV